MGGHGAIEVAKTVLEVADVAWTAMECRHHHQTSHEQEGGPESKCASSEDELEALRSENRRLRNLLEQNLKLLQDLSESPCLFNDCPPDLYVRLVATVDSKHFLTRLKSLQQASANGTSYEFPFKEATGDDLHSAEILIKVDNEEPSWWVWVTDEMVPGKVEEWSGIDNENYVVVSEEHVVDGVANFMARCIISNSKARNLTPEELQKTLGKALGDVSKLEKVLNIWHAGKLFYALSTWGLALAGLYRGRAVLKLAAMGVHSTSKVVLRAL
ncbi:hypothetical protein FH972_016003 [Carpinus fangiana]|uniref:Uncharacterized protein n=1 Tax=Carpinus fangiana TaxID=176857 RepID=A0A5N6RH96_9ROSI|nr:hypothetical protein FH972_016003 [Carpinus fangiana]